MRRTPLHSVHQRLGARLVPFAGWEMPVQYTGIVAEHRAVRSAAGLFDVSHMGELDLRGPGAAAAVARLTCADVDRIAVGQARYSLVLNEAAGIIDDVIVYRLADRHYRLVVNASNTDAVHDHARADSAGSAGVELVDRSAELALLAVQGPRALDIVAQLADGDVASIGTYRCRADRVAGNAVLLARTGYTGEDGFELFVAAEYAETLWNALLEAGAAPGLQAAGLGARDTLRLEASMPLYGPRVDPRGVAAGGGPRPVRVARRRLRRCSGDRPAARRRRSAPAGAPAPRRPRHRPPGVQGHHQRWHRDRDGHQRQLWTVAGTQPCHGAGRARACHQGQRTGRPGTRACTGRHRGGAPLLQEERRHSVKRKTMEFNAQAVPADRHFRTRSK